jgi:acetoacetate decarboxylase
MSAQLPGFRHDPGERYDMPAVFGPTQLPVISTWGRMRAIDVSFVTTHEALRPFVPYELDLPTEPVLTVSRRSFTNVDYLAGRGYEELCIGIRVSQTDGDSVIRGTFWPVMWVDQVMPIIVGREYSGFAKLGAEFTPVAEQGTDLSFAAFEYGTRLLSGEVTAVEPLPEQDARRAAARASEATAFCVRHIPAIAGGRGLHQTTRLEMTADITAIRRGVGHIHFDTPSWADAPHSSRVMAALDALPIVRMCPAYVIEGSSAFDRSSITALTDLVVQTEMIGSS